MAEVRQRLVSNYKQSVSIVEYFSFIHKPIPLFLKIVGRFLALYFTKVKAKVEQFVDEHRQKILLYLKAFAALVLCFILKWCGAGKLL